MEKKVLLALIVDDYTPVQSAINNMLKIYGFKAEFANDGMEALQKIKTTNYDLIFSDIEMPNMNGMELLAKVKRMPEKSTIPFVLLTSVMDNEVETKAKKLGVSKYLYKPYSMALIQSALTELGLIK